MDAEQFDSVAKALGQGNSRRGVVRTLTGAALGGILVAVGVGEAGAKKKHKKHSQVQAQNGPCKLPNNSKCGTKGKNATCFDLQTDRSNCGTCGRACDSGYTCQGGQCWYSGCGSSSTDCNGTCVNLQEDYYNCGSCNYGAPDGCGGAGGKGACCFGTCVNLFANNSNCGACGHACASCGSSPSGCWQSVTNEGFCGDAWQPSTCTSDTDCGSGYRCAVADITSGDGTTHWDRACVKACAVS